MMSLQFEAPNGLAQDSVAFIKYLEGKLGSVDVERLQQFLQDLAFCCHNEGYRDYKAIHENEEIQ
jgi:hypothetical protein